MKIIKFTKLIILSFIITLNFSCFSNCLAVGLGDAFGDNLNKAAGNAGYQTNSQDVNPFISNIINTAISLVGVIFLGLMIYAGYLWMTARGEEAKTTTAKNIITAAIIGIALILLAYVISMWVMAKLGSNTLKT